MNKIFLFVLFSFSFFHSMAQDDSYKKKRNAEIKKWYGEVQAIGLKNCRSKSLNEDVDGYEFSHVVKVCRINDRYEVTKCESEASESSREVNVYRKDGKVFFVFIKGGDVIISYEKRYYCDENEYLIQQLEKEWEDGGGAAASNKEVKLPAVKQKIQKVLSDEFADINKVLRTGN